jgi:hypothetical protein
LTLRSPRLCHLAWSLARPTSAVFAALHPIHCESAPCVPWSVRPPGRVSPVIPSKHTIPSSRSPFGLTYSVPPLGPRGLSSWQGSFLSVPSPPQKARFLSLLFLFLFGSHTFKILGFSNTRDACPYNPCVFCRSYILGPFFSVWYIPSFFTLLIFTFSCPYNLRNLLVSFVFCLASLPVRKGDVLYMHFVRGTPIHPSLSVGSLPCLALHTAYPKIFPCCIHRTPQARFAHCCNITLRVAYR